MGHPGRRRFIGEAAVFGGCLAVCGLRPCPARAGSGEGEGEEDEFRWTAFCCQRCDTCQAYLDEECPSCKAHPSAGECRIKRCAVEREVATCAHCEDFPTCPQPGWKEHPEVRALAEALRKKLQETHPS